MRWMMRTVAVLLAAVLIVGGGMIWLAQPGPAPRQGRVYTVPQFVALGTAVHRRQGQSAWVRGALACAPASEHTCWITGWVVGSADGTVLMVHQDAGNPFFLLARRVPLLASLLPHTAADPLTGREAIYRITYTGCLPVPACPPGRAAWRLADGGRR